MGSRVCNVSVVRGWELHARAVACCGCVVEVSVVRCWCVVDVGAMLTVPLLRSRCDAALLHPCVVDASVVWCRHDRGVLLGWGVGGLVVCR